jgi:peroxiredoxin
MGIIRLNLPPPAGTLLLIRQPLVDCEEGSMHIQVRIAALALPIVAGSLILLFTALNPRAASCDSDVPSSNLGKTITKLDLKDTTGKTWTTADLQGKKAVIVLFLGTQCPINNAYLPRLKEMHKTYAARGVQFLAINPNKQDKLEMIAAHAKEFAIPFPVLKDANYQATDLFGARRTPEAFVLDANLKIRYQGRIDDQFGKGGQRSEPTRADLAMALDEVLAGTPVSKATTPVEGCLIGRTKQPTGLRSPTASRCHGSSRNAARNAIAPARLDRCR